MAPPWTRFAVLLLTATTVVATGIEPAVAGPAQPRVSYAASADWSIGAYEWRTATVTCPAGRKAINGGEDNGSSGTVLLTSSEPTADGNGWRVAVRNRSAQGTTYRAWAMCASVTGYQFGAGSQQSVQPGDTWLGSGSCGSGLIGGGFHTADQVSVGVGFGFFFNWYAYFMESDAWITNLSWAATDARTIAICGDGFAARETYGTGVTAQPGQTVDVTATCGEGTNLLGGGGYSESDDSPGHLVDSQPLPIDSQRAQTWKASIRNAGPAAATMRAVALCSV